MLSIAITLLSILPLSMSKGTIPPTVLNDTGEYYITQPLQDFEDQIIECSSPNCYVICNEKNRSAIDNSCLRASINASLSSSLTIECLGKLSCDHTKVRDGPTDHINIKCSGSNACYNAEFNMDATNDVQIECRNDGDLHTPGNQCSWTTFNALHSKSVTVSCSGYQACSNTDIDAEYAESVSIVANGTASLWFASVHALNAGSLDLVCAPKPGYYNETTCEKGELYIPSSGFSLSCYGRGCQWLPDIYVTDEIVNVTIGYLNGCGECGTGYGKDCMPSDNTIYCDWNGSNVNNTWTESDLYRDTNGYCDTDNCGCSVLLNEMESAYIDDASVCPSAPIADKGKVKKVLFGIVFILGIIGGVVGLLICLGIVYYVYFASPKQEAQSDALLPEVDANAVGVSVVEEANEPPAQSAGYVPPTTVTVAQAVEEPSMGDNPVRYNL